MPYASSQNRAAVSFSPSGPAQAVIERGRGVEQAGFAGRRLRICLAASGGGHLRQLLDLQKVWSAHDYLFITEDTSLGRSIAQSHPAAMVPHFALGQLRLNGLRRMIGGGLGNLVRSARIIRKFRPDVVISTGAGTVFFPVFWARLSGAEIILIESFARFNKPSLFARLSAPLSHRVLLQSEALRRFFPRAIVFDPLRVIAAPRPPKKPLAFVTVGATLPFDRLIAMVADLKAQGLVPEVVKYQIGVGGGAPAGADAVETMGFDEVQQVLAEASIVICHAGTGSLITALRQSCHVIAVPRLHALGEVYDDHQEQIAAEFESRGLIQVARTTEELAAALREVRRREPVTATTDQTEMIQFLRQHLANMTPRPRVHDPISLS